MYKVHIVVLILFMKMKNGFTDNDQRTNLQSTADRILGVRGLLPPSGQPPPSQYSSCSEDDDEEPYYY